MARGRRFWLRISDGLVLNQLWRQFHTEARTGYRLYSQEVRSAQIPAGSRRKRFIHMLSQFCWAVIEKLSPVRRVLLLIALMLLFTNVEDVSSGGRQHVVFFFFQGAFWGGLLILFLLVLEVADRVVMKRDLQIAKEIQTWLLPEAPPQVEGLEIAFFTRPANTVAGDYYDVFLRPSSDGAQQTFLIAIADVAGKSIPAALLMATFQASLKTLARMPGSLTDLAGEMNRYVCGNSQSGRRFITTFLAEFDPLTRQLVYVNCGQNAPILRRGTGGVERLTEGGIPLGIFGETAYESAAVTLQSSDMLVLFTDGVTEAEDNRAEEYGETRLLAAIHQNAALRPPQMLSAVLQGVDRFVGDTPQHDDITLMLLRLT